MIEQFTNLYSLSKTLRFSLIPVGKTEEIFIAKQLLSQDEQRAKSYQKVKGYMDNYHKMFIESVLSGILLNRLDDYAALYFKPNKDEKDTAQMESMEAAYRKQISDAFKKNSIYKKLSGKEFVRELLPAFLESAEEKATVREFNDFTTYFTGFFQNRENMYSDEAKPTAISNRCINENLPKYLDNTRSFRKIRESLPEDKIIDLFDEFEGLMQYPPEYYFRPDHFTFVLSQSQIDRYNKLIGGYTTSDGAKMQGLNEYVNLYNQEHKTEHLPLLKPLFKQILSDRENISFVQEPFENDTQTLDAIRKFFEEALENENTFFEALRETEELFAALPEYNTNGVFVKNGRTVTDLSNSVFGNWGVIPGAWTAEYESLHPIGKKQDAEKYEEAKKKAYKAQKSFSVARLQALGDSVKTEVDAGADIVRWLQCAVNENIEKLRYSYDECKALLHNEYKSEKKLAANEDAVARIKDLLDSTKDLENLLAPFTGSGKEENKDNAFYGKFLPLYETLSLIDRLYDKVRNYVTQKPYSKDKIKLNFENPQFLGGWDRNKERDYRCVILRKNSKYYLAVMDKSAPKVFESIPQNNGEDLYEKMDYKLLPGPNKMLPKVFFAKSNLAFFAPSSEILSIRERESFKKGQTFNIDDCRKMIDFYKQSIQKHSDWKQFGFSFAPTEEYTDIGAFYREVKEQGFMLRFQPVPESYINDLINEGRLYLFQIYNKDFSEYSHGKPNLHTLYFKMLFDPENLKDVVYKLNGEAEMFFRYPSISDKEKIVHPANTPLTNKNPDNPKNTSTFSYDIVKDKRYTKPVYSLHIPITMNFKGDDYYPMNLAVRSAIRKKKEQYVIGIDRGERNLIYVCVINGKGEIVEQHSLNEIVSDNGYTVDYHDLLNRKEKERDDARKSWSSIESIKELKEGYMSQVVRKICELVVKYDAVIALEDLNSGFKNSRVKVEKQVYNKFEKMLIDKLNYLVISKDPAQSNAPGGLLHAYQLANKADKAYNGRQNGILFYVPAWLTSKIDPSTGFVDLLKPKYTSVQASADFFAAFDEIGYLSDEDLFAFKFDYRRFPRCDADFRKVWTVYSNGERIRTVRDSANNGEWTSKTVNLTKEFKALFKSFNMDINGDLKAQIIMNRSAEFHRELMKLFALTLQMRNSETGKVDVDYLISPVKNASGGFYCSSDYSGDNAVLPTNADANGAYHIAKKALWAMDQIRTVPENQIDKVNLSISKKEWLASEQNK